MADDKYKPSNNIGTSGVFQYTAGTSYKAVLGGSTSCTIGATTAVAAAVDNKFTIGTSNSFKASLDVSISYGNSFTNKKGNDFSYKGSSIAIAEYSGARCLDLFQASAGLGNIARAVFTDQKRKVDTATTLITRLDALMALGTLAMAGVGTGFQDRAVDNNKDETTKNTIAAATSALTTLGSLIPTLGLLTERWLKKQDDATQPRFWNPTSVIQASSSKGVFIGAHGSEVNAIRSSFIQNSEGTEWLVFRAMTNPTYTTEQIVGSKLNTDQCITGFDSTGATGRTLFQLTESKATLNTKQLELEGKAEEAGVHTGTGMTAVFQEVKLTATGIPNGAGPPNAELSLAGTRPSAKLIASTPGASSSVEATPTSVMLASGPLSSLKLNSSSVALSARDVKLSGSTTAQISGSSVKISSLAAATINGKVIRIG